jgi:hypothetical protein
VEPQHVHRDAELRQREAGCRPKNRVPTIRRHGQLRCHRQFAVSPGCRDPTHSGAVAHQPGHLGSGDEPEVRQFRRLGNDEVQEVPLRHQCQETCAAAKSGEVDRLNAIAAEHDIQAGDLVVGQREERVLQAEFVQQVDC